MSNVRRGPRPGTPSAKHGGQAVRAKYGAAFYARIGKIGGQAVKARYGSQFYSRIGRKGGEATMRQQGSEFFRRIGRRGGQQGRRVLKQVGASGYPLAQ